MTDITKSENNLHHLLSEEDDNKVIISNIVDNEYEMLS